MTKSSAETEVKLDWKAQKEEQARIRKRQNDLKKVEDEIHRLETRDSEIDTLLSQEEIYTNVARLVELNNEKESLQQKLEELYETWEELAEYSAGSSFPFYSWPYTVTVHFQSHKTPGPAPRSNLSHSQCPQTYAELRPSARSFPEFPLEHPHGSA